MGGGGLGGLAFLRLLRRFHDRAGRVVHQFTHRDGGNRHRRDVRARGRGDVGRAGEAGPDVRNDFVEHHHDLEVRRLRRLRAGRPLAAWIGLLPISLTCPLNVRSGSASMVILATCPMLTLGMLVSSTSTSA